MVFAVGEQKTLLELPGILGPNLDSFLRQLCDLEKLSNLSELQSFCLYIGNNGTCIFSVRIKC